MPLVLCTTLLLLAKGTDSGSASYWQPLDRGVIASFKLPYRRQWISYILRQHEANEHPNKTVHLLKAYTMDIGPRQHGITYRQR
jgi:hypothetical protein